MEIHDFGQYPRLVATTFFVPECNFTRPNRDEVDLNASFPLSRFVGNLSSFNITFALGGANSSSVATLAVEGRPTCIWRGTELQHGEESFCAHMETDQEADLRVFRGVFKRKANVSNETFVFGSDAMLVAVSVDYLQSDKPMPMPTPTPTPTESGIRREFTFRALLRVRLRSLSIP
eukprot:TsM_000405300 transcript=TsM_000405300 gene=TsM_000405300